MYSLLLVLLILLFPYFIALIKQLEASEIEATGKKANKVIKKKPKPISKK